ncbi:MAG: dihydrolipoyl dehydrogenase [Chloroflexota bacterium]
MAEHFDIVVIGGGPGGYAAALYAAAAGMRVAVVEKDKVGGTCLHRGCIPAKEFLETAHVYRTVAGAKDFGVQADHPGIDFAVSQERKRKVVEGQWRGLTGLMRARGITVVEGTGTLHPGRRVQVSGGAELSGDHVVLATGSVPRLIPGFERDGRFVLTSDEVLDLTTLPASVAVIGGGAIGCEFASFFADLGTQVTLLEALPKLLPGCDADVVDVVVRSFRRRGIDVRCGVTVHGHEPDGNQTVVHFGEGASVTVDAVVVAVGRRPQSEGLLADGTGVEVDERGFVRVDEWCRTGAEGVWAIGDLIATPALAHVGFAEAICVVRQILGEPVFPIDYSRVPWCIYCHPEVAFAGMTEEDAVRAGYEVVTAKHLYRPNGRAVIIGDTEGLVKVICEKTPDGGAGRVLGVHMVGPWVTEQLGQGYLALNWEATPAEIAPFIQPHPTLSEVFGETILSLTGRGLHG